MGRKLVVISVGLLLITSSFACGKGFEDTVWVGSSNYVAVTLQFLTKNSVKIYYGNNRWNNDFYATYNIEEGYIKLSREKETGMLKIDDNKITGRPVDLLLGSGSYGQDVLILEKITTSSKDYTPYTELEIWYNEFSDLFDDAVNSLKNINTSKDFIATLNNTSDRFVRVYKKIICIRAKFPETKKVNANDINTFPNPRLKSSCERFTRSAREFFKPETQNLIIETMKKFKDDKEVGVAVLRLSKAAEGKL